MIDCLSPCYDGWSDPETSLFHIKGTGAVPAMQRWLKEGSVSELGLKDKS